MTAFFLRTLADSDAFGQSGDLRDLILRPVPSPQRAFRIEAAQGRMQKSKAKPRKTEQNLLRSLCVETKPHQAVDCEPHYRHRVNLREVD